jgi:hypothetical protein
LLITSALNSTCLLQSALNPTFLLQVNDFPTHLYLGSNTNTACSEAERLVVTANVTPKTTNSNSVLPNTASNDIQQHVNSGDVDIRNLTITLIKEISNFKWE